MKSRLIFLGSGSSTGTPYLNCIATRDEPCEICSEALENRESRNWRGNVSLLVQYGFESDQQRNVLIDCGKTFRQSVQRFFPKYKISSIDAILLTHDHADAVLGLDDIRDLQKSKWTHDPVADVFVHETIGRIELHGSRFTLDRMHLVYPYLLSARSESTNQLADPVRYVAKLSTHCFDDENLPMCVPSPFDAVGVPIRPLRVWHGGTYTSYGFVFGSPQNAFVYISDVSSVPKETQDFLDTLKIEVLVLDSLFMTKFHATHMCLPQSLEYIRLLRPRMSYLVGMTHEWDYYKMNDTLKAKMSAEGLNVEMAYDGLCFEMDL